MARCSTTFPPPEEAVRTIVKTALQEDLQFGDLTSNILIDAAWQTTATIMAKQPMVVAGVLGAMETFKQVDPGIRIQPTLLDGEQITAAAGIMTVSGAARSILQGERVALNFLQRLSGISTLTHRCCSLIQDSHTTIVDTRKTTPGLRLLEKWAVRLGGGRNHRFSLQDGILIKDNHLSILAAHKTDLAKACLLARQGAPHGLRISVEVETLAQVRQALKGKADIILLDNMSPAEVKQAVDIIQGRAITEVSGGITIHNLAAMADAKPDFISMGSLTYSGGAMDFTMEVGPLGKRSASKAKRTLSR
jgi:nicotinate-nucleotide pyrophosphorylase (carboxylating)